MAKESLKDMVIPEIPQDEAVLKEGVVNVLMVVGGNRRRSVFKYAITDRGLWTRNKGVLWIKPRSTFLPYSNIESYKRTKYFNTESMVFFLKSGKRPGGQIIFDDMPGALEVLNKYIKVREGK